MNSVFKSMTTLLFAASMALASYTAPADTGGFKPEDKDSCKNVEPYDGVTSMDEEFGAGAQDITRCLTVRHHAKVVISVESVFPITPAGTANQQKATFLSNIEHMVRNYEMHGMTIGKDVDVVVVFSQVGALLATESHPVFAGAAGLHPGNPTNSFRAFVDYGLAHGFKFYLCQTASRQLGITMNGSTVAPVKYKMIPGINFVPGGQIAVADFEMLGYAVLRP